VSDEQAKQLRGWSQAIGLSNPTQGWDDISEPRRDQWRRFTRHMHEDGVRIISVDDLKVVLRLADYIVPASEMNQFDPKEQDVIDRIQALIAPAPRHAPETDGEKEAAPSSR